MSGGHAIKSHGRSTVAKTSYKHYEKCLMASDSYVVTTEPS